jgi:hypothetical protein
MMKIGRLRAGQFYGAGQQLIEIPWLLSLGEAPQIVEPGLEILADQRIEIHEQAHQLGEGPRAAHRPGDRGALAGRREREVDDVVGPERLFEVELERDLR